VRVLVVGGDDTRRREREVASVGARRSRDEAVHRATVDFGRLASSIVVRIVGAVGGIVECQRESPRGFVVWRRFTAGGAGGACRR
jgi:hypothetical protein